MASNQTASDTTRRHTIGSQPQSYLGSVEMVGFRPQNSGGEKREQRPRSYPAAHHNYDPYHGPKNGKRKGIDDREDAKYARHPPAQPRNCTILLA
jgi:hypothetical protein